ncbi:Eco57I restriction-modification methylase domain-containing protein [Bacillus safensis]|uniref:Eco57I restriction-modification methylase domain-containing protein n=1 Tax=Bacillus safensis TaxID=561879 RepID=UPI0024530F3C|nr:Eco57I restriction-modification methylase domain-containing protein [Bacillus safensis]MDH3094447.1 Eco57I restriction-modification methylase domain-containing protein [Bacillus safensis]
MDELFLEVIEKESNLVNKKRLGNANKDKNEQFFTPLNVASYMGSMFKETKQKVIYFLDPGAGIGNLTAAFIATVCKWSKKPQKIIATLYEVDSTLIPDLQKNVEEFVSMCSKNDIVLEVRIENTDFIQGAIDELNQEIKNRYDYIIINPPYKKMSSSSFDKKITSKVGINVPNYYAAFVSLSIRLMNEKGQLVFITPRSFCNGQYFKSFRYDLLGNTKIEKIHNFISRKDIFYDDVLQETVIFFITKNKQKLNNNIEIRESGKSDFSQITKLKKRFDNIVFPHDQEKIIRIIKDDDIDIVEKMHSLPNSLEELGINVSTGPIVDFREKEGLLTFQGTLFSIPIIYPENFIDGFIQWPFKGKKPQYLKKHSSNAMGLRPPGFYVLVKRFSSKEEEKRIVAAVYSSKMIGSTEVAFDNKTNYYHISKEGLYSEEFAKGLSLYLNSSLVDFYFRTFSGSTQVNVSDLKSIKYPSYKSLIEIGKSYDQVIPDQKELDRIVDKVLYSTKETTS